MEIDEVRSIDSRQRHTWARPSAASFAPVRPPAFTPPPRRPAQSRSRGAPILRLQRAQAEGGAAIDEAQRRGRRRDAARPQPARPARWPRQAGGGRFQHVPQMIEFAAGMTRGQLHADAAGPVLPGLGPRAGVQQRRVQHVGRTRQAAARLARRPGRWPRPAAASRPTRAANRGRISASTRRVFSRASAAVCRRMRMSGCAASKRSSRG